MKKKEMTNEIIGNPIAFYIDIDSLKNYKFLEKTKDKLVKETYLILPYKKKLISSNGRFICDLSKNNTIKILTDLLIYITNKG